MVPLVLTTRRPRIVEKGNCKHSLKTIDDWYFKKIASYRKMILKKHPDQNNGQAGRRFRLCLAQYKEFKKKANWYYKWLGVNPPNGKDVYD